MGLIAPPNYIAPTGISGHRFGLYSVATILDDNVRWELGTETEPLTGLRAELRASDCVDDYTQDVPIRSGEDLTEAAPFFVAGTYSCKASSRPMEEAEQRARLHLSGGEERAVEWAISNPIVGNAPSFQSATDLTPTAGVGMPLVIAIGLLEEALYDQHHSTGVIHAPRLSGALFGYDSLASRAGQKMETQLGTAVSFGYYRNIAPDGSPAEPNTMWVYAAGVPSLRRGTVFVQSDSDNFLDRANNDVAIIAQRPVLVSWDGPTFGVLVDLSSYGVHFDVGEWLPDDLMLLGG
jgi:hypothetical protein